MPLVGNDPVVTFSPATGELCEQWTTAAKIKALEPALAAVADATLDDVAKAASLHLFTATGSVWTGSCEVVLRPSALAHAGRGPCGQPGPDAWRLDGPPVTSVVEILVDGAVLAPAGYALYEGSVLRRLDTGDGVVRWPYHCQDLSLASSEKGTWQVKVTRGVPPPELWQHHATVFGAQLGMAFSGEPCLLPADAVTVSARGVTINRDPSGPAPTGLPDIDRAVAVANSGRVSSSAFVWSPNKVLGRRPG